jgi:CHAT domain-containing protein
MKEDTNPNRLANDETLAQALNVLVEERERVRNVKAFSNGFGSSLHSDCAAGDDWLRLAEGEAEPAEVSAWLTHVASCPSCAGRLRTSLRLDVIAPSTEETAELEAFKSTSRAWQRRLAAELARTPYHGQRARPRFHIWIGAGVAASLLIAALAVFWWQRANSPERLLAEAYGQSRIFVLRMPGAAHADVTPQTQLRGGDTGREAAKLLEARATIERHLERAPQDPHWSELEARSDVLEGKFDAAVNILDRLAAAAPVTPGLLLDDASAYFQRGVATGSENDRATALDDLRRADELAPGDPVVLFNEAVVMEERGQVMNAVETWDRYLKFERDPKWLAEGRSRLAALEQKLDRMKTHRSRMEQHLATPQAMRALAGDSVALGAVDEELASTLLPKMLYAAFPAPSDRSRGSPCGEACMAARRLLRALSESLRRNHQDPWLTNLLPSDSSPPPSTFSQAAHALGVAIDANERGNRTSALASADESSRLFHELGNEAGQDRAQAERVYALQRLLRMADCREAAQPLLHGNPSFAWIQVFALTENAICSTGPGTASTNTPAYEQAQRLAQDHHYAQLEFRAVQGMAGTRTESGDPENGWRIAMQMLRKFYAGDYPPIRLTPFLASLADVERTTPRARLDLLLWREYEGSAAMSPDHSLLAASRRYVAAAAIRSGEAAEAEQALLKAGQETDSSEMGTESNFALAFNEIDLANFFLGRGTLPKAADWLDAAKRHMAGNDDFLLKRSYAAARGELELAQGHPEAAETMLREAILDEERQAEHVGAGNVIFALQNRDLYADLAEVWLAQHRSGEDVLALWERYRLRILGESVPVCERGRLDCLEPQLQAALQRLGPDRLLGQIALPDRVLLYGAGAQGVVWSSVAVGKDDLLAAVGRLENAASSPATSQESVDQAARRVGEILLPDAGLAQAGGQLLLEPDPLLGNLPWPAVEVSGKPMGLEFAMEETPSLLLANREATSRRGDGQVHGNALVVGASVAAGDDTPLPEALAEARDVARFESKPTLLVGAQATEKRVEADIGTAPLIHFAGHAVRQNGETRLALAPGGDPYVDSALLRKHPPRAARLVVFSACSTGKREEAWNHDMGDIVNTLASLGVPEVVATRWQIDSSSAVPMMDAFYGGVAEGLTVSRALRLARLSLSRDPRYRHPYYWAAYYASGTGKTDLREVIHGGQD